MLRRISPMHTRGGATPRQKALMQTLKETQNALQGAYITFDSVSDPELTESCIYEIHALHAKMNYLLRSLKEEEQVAAAAAEGGRRKWI